MGRPPGRPWAVAAAVGVMLLITIADLLATGRGFVVLLVLPLVVVSAIASPWTTAMVGVLACLLTVAAGIPDGDFTDIEGWLHLLTMVLATVLATWFSVWLNQWRASVRQQEEKFRLLAENAMDLVISIGNRSEIAWVSPSANSLLGRTPEELLGRDVESLVHADDRATLTASMKHDSVTHNACRVRMLPRASEPVWVEATPRCLYGPGGDRVGAVIGVRDIDAEVQAHDALAREVEFDALTGLAKRGLALSRIQSVLDNRRADGWALLCIGVDGMTAINQAYSFTAGDAVLVAVADRLTGAAGAHDRIARITGDEFVALLLDVVTPTDAANAAERLLSAVRGPVEIDDTTIDVTACVGVAMSDGQSAEDLVRDATAAMRAAAARGGDRWEFADGDVGDTMRQTLSVQSALRDALAAGQVVPWLMPVMRLDNGQVVGWEALARWMRPDGDVTEPAMFTEIAERGGLIIGVDDAILRRSVVALASLPEHQSVAVNISAHTLSAESLPSTVIDVLRENGVSPSRLHLEVTETSLLRVTEQVRHTMSTLADLGVSWWVDDFGTGFSSIAHLRDLPITGLKLDRSFTAGISAHDTYATRLAEGLAGLARGLDLQTIAEGIETAEQARVLEAQGWQMGQGWLYGKAVPA